MAIKSGIFNSVNGDRRYKADFFAEYFATFIANGVFPNPSSGFQVMANNNRTITLKAGKAWIHGYYVTNDTDYNLTVDVADGVLNRIDRVVLQLNYLNREITPLVKKGTFASSPVAPTLKRDADAYEIALADIYVGKGIISITQANITDQRLNTSLCGIVHGTVNQVDTTTLFNQYQSWFGQFTTAKQVDFEAWLATLQDILSGDVAANLAARIQTLETDLARHLAEDASGAHKAKNIEVVNADNLFTATDVEGALKEVITKANSAFQSGVDGKNKLETAILAKKGTVSKQETIATFDELDLGIKSIPEEVLRMFPTYSRLHSYSASGTKSVVNENNVEVSVRGATTTWYLEEYDKNGNVIKSVTYNLPFSTSTSLITPYTVQFYRGTADGYDIYDHNGNLLHVKYGRVGLHQDVIKHRLTNELLFLDCRVTSSRWETNVMDSNKNKLATYTFGDGTGSIDSTNSYTRVISKGIIMSSTYETSASVRGWGLITQEEDGLFYRVSLGYENTETATTKLIFLLTRLLRRVM